MAEHPLPGRNLVRKMAQKQATQDIKTPQEPQKGPARPRSPRKGGKGPPRQFEPRLPHSRLPNGSSFTLVWDQQAEKWSGILQIPGEPFFKCTARTVFTLCSKLDNYWRKFLKEKKPGVQNCTREE